MKQYPTSITATLSLAIVLTATGCINLEPANDTTRFYVLDTTIEPVAMPGKRHVLVRNVSLADYLQNSQIVQRDGANKVSYSAGHRWAGSLEKMISEIVAEEISLSSPGLYASTLPTGIEEMFLDINVVRFDFSAGGATTLVMESVLTNAKSQERIQHQRIKTSRAIAPEAGYEEIVNSLEQTLRAGIREISIE